jgi:hypothetical protein
LGGAPRPEGGEAADVQGSDPGETQDTDDDALCRRRADPPDITAGGRAPAPHGNPLRFQNPGRAADQRQSAVRHDRRRVAVTTVLDLQAGARDWSCCWGARPPRRTSSSSCCATRSPCCAAPTDDHAWTGWTGRCPPPSSNGCLVHCVAIAWSPRHDPAARSAVRTCPPGPAEPQARPGRPRCAPSWPAMASATAAPIALLIAAPSRTTPPSRPASSSAACCRGRGPTGATAQ